MPQDPNQYDEYDDIDAETGYGADDSYDAEALESDLLPDDVIDDTESDAALAAGEASDIPAAAPGRGPRKRTPLFNIIVVGVAVLAGGFMILNLISSKKGPTGEMAAPPVPADISAPAVPVLPDTPVPDQAQQASAAPVEAEYPVPDPVSVPQPPPESAEALPPVGGFVGDPARMVKAEQVPVPAPSAVTQDSPMVPLPPPAAETPEASEQAGAPPMPPPAAAPTPAVATDVPPAADDLVPSAERMAAQHRSEVEALNTELQALRAQVTQLQEALAEAKTGPSPAAMPAPENAAPIVLESKIDQPDALSDLMPKAKPKRPARQADDAYEALPVWELRSARPGSAMVGRQGETDLRPVTVGDTLPGIGQITAITREGGRWVVSGTLGRIAQ